MEASKSKYLKKSDVVEKIYEICYNEIKETLQTSTFYNEILNSDSDNIVLDKKKLLKKIKNSEEKTQSFLNEKSLKTESKFEANILQETENYKRNKSKKSKKLKTKENQFKEKLFNDCDLINCFYLMNTLKTDVNDVSSTNKNYKTGNREHLISFKDTKTEVDSHKGKMNKYSKFQLKKIKKCYNLLSNLDLTESEGKNLFAKNYLKYNIISK